MVGAMRICRYLADGGTARVGYLDGELIVPVAGGDGQAGLDAVLELAMAANADPDLRPSPDGNPVPLASTRLLAPVADPPSIRDFYAFEQHVRTAGSRRGKEMPRTGTSCRSSTSPTRRPCSGPATRWPRPAARPSSTTSWRSPA